MTAPVEVRRGARLVVTGGNFLQFFDWIVYSLFAPVFAQEFFGGDQVGATVGAFLVYGGSMLLRPVGGALGGFIADRSGRRQAMVVGMSVAGVASLVMGALPGSAAIGVCAPVLLVLARSAQALAFGAEWPTAVTYLMEVATDKSRLRYGSYFIFTCTAGGFAASALGTLLSSVLSHDALVSWGWRVPFLLAGSLSLLLCLLRRGLPETPAFLNLRATAAKQARPRRPPLRVLASHWRALLTVAALAAAASASTTTFAVIVPTVAQERLGASPSTVLGANTLVTGLLLLLVLPLGYLGERIGLRRVLALTSVGFLVALPALYTTLSPSYGGLVLACGVGMLLSSFQGLALPQAMTSMFPVELRGLGVGLSQGVADAVFGGFAPATALALDRAGHDGWFIAGVCLLVLVGWSATVAALRRAEVAAPDQLPADVLIQTGHL
ncbi:MFS transporter [Streptomyces sp. NPDC087263]|uniref:MFS transporter n=1 Tax=Streptomyces sp. NPDC087263 TaxID=3365773 RepID=UPI0037F3BDEF